MSHYCVQCNNPLLGGSHICPSCGYDNALGALPQTAAPSSAEPGAAGATHGNGVQHPAHHPPHEFGSLSPLTEKSKRGSRAVLAIIAVSVIGIVVYMFISWNRQRLNNTIAWDSPPQAIEGLPTGGLGFTCVITQNGKVMCWGNSDAGQLGDTVAMLTGEPIAVHASGTFTSVDAGDSHACARSTTGQVVCWGSNARGQLGVATNTECKTEHGPVACAVIPVVAPTNFARSVTSGAEHSCAVGADSSITCWGTNTRGQLGVTDQPTGTLIAHPNTRLHFLAATAGGYHTCGILADGSLMCWGWNRYGQLGTASPDGCGLTMYARTPCSLTPIATAPGKAFLGVTAGRDHTCGVLRDGTAWCWGANRRGQVGNGTTSDSVPAPVEVLGGRRYIAVAAGQEFTCAIERGGTVWCWGDAGFHQFATADSTFSATPVQVPLLEPALSLGAGGQHACVVTVTKHVICWGAHAAGEIGKGVVGMGNTRLREAGPSGRGRTLVIPPSTPATGRTSGN